jgi:hypothetical protein
MGVARAGWADGLEVEEDGYYKAAMLDGGLRISSTHLLAKGTRREKERKSVETRPGGPFHEERRKKTSLRLGLPSLSLSTLVHHGRSRPGWARRPQRMGE